MKLQLSLLCSLVILLTSCSKDDMPVPPNPSSIPISGGTKYVKYTVSESSEFDKNGVLLRSSRDSNAYYYSNQFELERIVQYQNGLYVTETAFTHLNEGAIVEKRITYPIYFEGHVYRYYFSKEGVLTRMEEETAKDGILYSHVYNNGVMLGANFEMNQKNQLIWIGHEGLRGVPLGQSPCDGTEKIECYRDIGYTQQPLRVNYHQFATIADIPILNRMFQLYVAGTATVLPVPPKKFLGQRWLCDPEEEQLYYYDFNYQFSDNRIIRIKAHMLCQTPKQDCQTLADIWIGYY